MPFLPKRPCRHPGCPGLCEKGHLYCEKHETGKTAWRNYDESSRQGSRQRGYDSRWDKARKTFLAAHPLCQECAKNGKYTKATVVDHIIPHRGNQQLFWDVNNWQALCKTCHDLKTAKGL